MTSRFMHMEQNQVQRMIDAASPDEIADLKLEAESASVEYGSLVTNGLADPTTKTAFHLAVETLVRLEAKKSGKVGGSARGDEFSLPQCIWRVEMFGFLYRGLVNDDAVLLGALVERAVHDYADLTPTEVRNAVDRDFADPNKKIDRHQVFFTYTELPEMDIGFPRLSDDDDVHDLSVIGKGKYTGFYLQVFGADNVHCFAINGKTFRATGPAKSLAKTMERKFGIDNVSREMQKAYS